MAELAEGHERLRKEWTKFNRYKELCENQRKQYVSELTMVANALASYHKDVTKSKSKIAKQRMQLGKYNDCVVIFLHSFSLRDNMY